ncbi:MAG: NAD(P)H-hydrate dehydratase [Alphaproteobacteria bacterium]|nr:NAD(P)H-hydrate dehydratase [Alphaproteobacteria bacterium]
MINTPDLWHTSFPKPGADSHKYTRGHAVIYGAPELTGATRLAAAAAARIGAGMVSVLCTEQTASIYKASLPAHILVRNDLNWWDERVTAMLWGSGGLPCPVNLREGIAAVLDAEAIKPGIGGSVLTPHEGEFARAFPHIQGTREERTIQAAQQTKAIMVLKGAMTVIAAPDGRCVVNSHACPYLASAGTGDVLAGMITGLLAQGMPGFEAACAAVWIHGECGLRIGAGLVASDVLDAVPRVLKEFS